MKAMILGAALAVLLWTTVTADEKGQTPRSGDRAATAKVHAARHTTAALFHSGTRTAKARWRNHGWEWRAFYLYDPAVKWVKIGRFWLPNRDGDWRVRIGDAFGHSMTMEFGGISAEAAVCRAIRKYRRQGHDRHAPALWGVEEIVAPTGASSGTE